jgi:hypothetical protein
VLTESRHETIALVSCAKSKQRGPCPARDLYVSPLFCKMRAYAERYADRWFILSAKYGLVAPETVLQSYDQMLTGASVRTRRAWAKHVYEQMEEAGLLHYGARFIWLAGRAYQRDLSHLLEGYEQHDPLAGKRLGERLSWLTGQLGA